MRERLEVREVRRAKPGRNLFIGIGCNRFQPFAHLQSLEDLEWYIKPNNYAPFRGGYLEVIGDVTRTQIC